MKTAHHRFAVAILALLVLPVPAWGADPIKAELDAARKVHADAVAAAKAVLLKAFDEEIKKVAATGDLDGVKNVQREKKFAANEHQLSRSSPFHKYSVAYYKKVFATTKVMHTALETAVKKYTMSLEFDKATAVQNELKLLAWTALRKLGTQLAPNYQYKQVRNVRSAILADRQLTDDKMVYLKVLENLEYLTLFGTKVTDAGLVHLKGFTKLKELNLGSTMITGAGLVHLEGLTNLTELSLIGTNVTDAGLAHLEGLKLLDRLWLSGTQVSFAGRKKLQLALPKCNIHP